ncbi:MAG: hypothetical protein HY721_33335 [Planctomycetes bacterium]|nr:hypothetical protein [Planctomycetota bacterium]
MTRVHLDHLATAIPFALGAALGLASCAGAGGQKAALGQLEPASCGSVKNIHAHQGVFLASQPSEEDLKLVKEKGVKAVVSLRRRQEIPWDEEMLVRDLGMEFHSLPFHEPAELTDEVFDSVRKLLEDPSKRPLLLHCGSANRVGAVWLPHRVLDGGLSYEDALAEAKAVGLRTPALEERAKAYIESHRK